VFSDVCSRNQQREKRLFQEAEDWILEKNRDWFFSFESICETLQLHPDYIRQGLTCWKEARRKISYFQENNAGSPTLLETSTARTSVRLSKTA